MLEEKDKPLDFATAQSTYKIIVALLEQVDASSSLITLLASALGEKATQGITQTSAWANYLTAKRALEALHPELNRFVTTVSNLADKQAEQAEQQAKAAENKE